MLRAIMFLMVAMVAQAATYTAATCSQSDVNEVVNNVSNGHVPHLVVDGDVIQIPSGSCTWTSGITVPTGVGISIIGAGQGSTTITSNAGSSNLFLMRPTYGNSTSRISGMTLQPQAATSLVSPIMIIGTCTVSGCPNIRVDHITLPSSWTSVGVSDSTAVRLDGVFGVLDHNVVGDVAGAGNGIDFVNVNHSRWKGVGVYGDNSWASDNTFGTEQAVYLEDNTFNYAFGTDVDGGDSYPHTGGGRLVCRYNTFNNLPAVSACGGHGTETTGRPRGIRQGEFYRNSVSSSMGGAGLGMRSGVGIAWGNTFSGSISAAATLSDQRLYRPVVWGFCNGANPYDVNDGGAQVWTGTVSSYSSKVLTVSGSPWSAGAFNFSASSPGSTYYTVFNATHGEMAGIASNTSNQLTLSWQLSEAGSPFYGGTTFAPGDSIVILSSTLYAAGTHTGSNGASVLTDSTKAWSANQWAGYNVINIGNAYSYQIGTNGTTTATAHFDPVTNVGGAWPGWTNGQQYVILRATRCLDQVSSYGGTLLSGEVPAARPTAQTLSPSYEVANAGNSTFTTDSLAVQANRDYYYTAPGFNGSVGTGSGTRASRPATCTTGVAYWATDEGTWNTSGSGGQGQLYTCTAPNTWTLAYTPYAYPHPLVSGTPPVNPPSGNGAPPTKVSVRIVW